MRVFAFMLGIPPAASTPAAEVYNDLIEEAVTAEAAGYDGVWVGEHHFVPDYSVISNPLLLATAIAARTRRIRLGAGCVVLPLHNPVRVAEDISMLDAISGGRVELALCRGDHPYEYESLGVPFAESHERYADGLATVQRVLTPAADPGQGARTSTGAELLNIPAPIQKPHPPLWATCGSAASMAMALANGLNVVVAGGSSRDRIEEHRRHFRGQCDKFDLDPERQRFGLLIYGWLARGAGELAKAAAAANFVAGMAAQLRQGHNSRPGQAENLTEPALDAFEAANLVGDEEFVASQMAYYQGLGVTDLFVQFPRSWSSSEIRDNMRRLAPTLGLGAPVGIAG